MSGRNYLVICTVALSSLLPAGAGTALAWGPNPGKQFPEFAGKKGSLGPVALLADVVVVEDVIGKTEKVYLEDCKRLGGLVLEEFAGSMREKGYQVQGTTLATVGETVDRKASYRVLPTWEQHTEDSEKFPVVPPPFHADSTIARDAASAALWSAVCRGALAFEQKKNKPAVALGEVSGLREPIGADRALVVLVVGTKIPAGKQFGQGMLSSLTRGQSEVGRAGNVSFSVSTGVDFTQYSGTLVKIAMIDVGSGEVLWCDQDFEDRSLNEERVTKLCQDVLKRLP